MDILRRRTGAADSNQWRAGRKPLFSFLNLTPDPKWRRHPAVHARDPGDPLPRRSWQS